MPKVCLRSIAETGPAPEPGFLLELNRLRTLAARDRTGRYQLTDDPAAADFILFVESSRYDGPSGFYFEGIRRDPVYRRFRDKSLIHSGFGFPIPFVPGIFPSIERTWCWRSRA